MKDPRVHTKQFRRINILCLCFTLFTLAIILLLVFAPLFTYGVASGEETAVGGSFSYFDELKSAIHSINHWEDLANEEREVVTTNITAISGFALFSLCYCLFFVPAQLKSAIFGIVDAENETILHHYALKAPTARFMNIMRFKTFGVLFEYILLFLPIMIYKVVDIMYFFLEGESFLADVPEGLTHFAQVTGVTTYFFITLGVGLVTFILQIIAKKKIRNFRDDIEFESDSED